MENLFFLGVIILLYLCMSLVWHQLFRFSSEESIVISACFIMIVGFFLGLAGIADMLYPLVLVLACIGLLSFICDFSFVKGDRKMSIVKRGKLFLSPSIVMLCVIYAYSVVAFKAALFTYPDDIIQWGSAVRYIHDTGRLYYSSDYIGQAIVFSTASIFQYLWSGYGAFYEKNCMIANFLLAFIPVFLPFSGQGWKEKNKIFSYTIIVFLSLNILSYIKYYNLLQDFILPLWAGGIIAWIIRNRINRKNILILLSSLLVIGAMKSMVGPLFAVAIIIMYIVVLLYEHNGKLSAELIRRIVRIALLAVASSGVLVLVWSIVLGQNAVGRSSLSLAEGKDIMQIMATVFRRGFIITSGVKAFPYMSYFMLLCLVIMIVWYLRYYRNVRNVYVTALTLYAIGFVVYYAIMVFAYVTIFGPEDSSTAAGLERYNAYYMILGVPVLASLLINENMFHTNIRHIRLLTMCIIMLLICSTGNEFIEKACTANIDDNSVYQIRLRTKDACDKMDELMDEEGRLYILGKIDAVTSKCVGYELEDRYSWNKDIYKMYLRKGAKANIYLDAVGQPSILSENNYRYIWIYGNADVDGYADMYNYYGIDDPKKNGLYLINWDNGSVTTTYLGKVKL